jgi:anthranilate synthase component 1
MFNQLTEKDFIELANQHERVMVFKEIFGDLLTPIQVFQALNTQMKGATLLESNPKEKTASARYSFLGFTPLAQLRIQDTDIQIQDEAGTRAVYGEPLNAIRDFFESNRAVMTHTVSGFAGGVAGFFAYDAARLFEEKLQNTQKPTGFPDILLKSYQDHVLFDIETGQVVLATLVNTQKKDYAIRYQSAMKRLNDFHEKILSKQETIPPQAKTDIHADTVTTRVTDDMFKASVKKAQSYIQVGDAFQVVVARTFETPCHAKPFDVYRVLRYRNPSPYMFYLDNDDYIVLGASPEIMVSVNHNMMKSCPLAGTRPRGPGYDDDVQSNDLLSDSKEVAEHMMLVDLARNDMGAVAAPGKVRVTALKHIKKFSHVMHISSTVEAPLAAGKDAMDALRAAFPAGTLSGAPKIRAMQIIDEIEGSRRQLYGGAIGYLNSRGDFDSCIAIRMAVFKEGVAYVTAGAGVVADSDPQKEADETRHKVRAVLDAIACADRGYV